MQNQFFFQRQRQDLQEDILTAICDRPDTWTRLLLNMERPHILSGVWKTKTWKTMTEDLKTKTLENEDPGQPLLI